MTLLVGPDPVDSGGQTQLKLTDPLLTQPSGGQARLLLLLLKNSDSPIDGQTQADQPVTQWPD